MMQKNRKQTSVLIGIEYIRLLVRVVLPEKADNYVKNNNYINIVSCDVYYVA